MIWVDGKIVDDNELKISACDRTFEHGLGLFETLRTWNGRAPLLDRHLNRMELSARALGLPYDGARAPDRAAVARLIEASGLGGDVVLRITLTGGLNETDGATLWMRVAPLPPPIRHEGAVVELGSWQVLDTDPMARHKALNYWPRRLAYESASRLGLDEVVSVTPEGVICEGSRTNVFYIEGSTLFTPSTLGPIVPGIMRELVLILSKELPLTISVGSFVRRKNLVCADEVFLTNSVRGIIPVSRVLVSRPTGVDTTKSRKVPGPWTQRLMILVYDYLRAEENQAP
jgi:branched-subunit amino acid aminotransferase/4-amino-4-deoxychorismate lyase